MKRIIALLISGVLLISCCFLSVSAADNSQLDIVFSKAFNNLSWMYYGKNNIDFFYSLSEGPKAEFVNEYLIYTRALEQYIGAQSPDNFTVSEEKYEKLAFTYFEKTNKLLDDLHSLDIYTTDGYKSYEGAWGGPSVGFKYIKSKGLTDERYEVFSYIYWQYAESPDDNIIETEYTPSTNEVKDRDYIVFRNDSNTDVYAKIIGGIKSTVYFDGINPPKYLSIEKLPKDDFLNILNVIDNPVSSTPSGSGNSSTPSDTGTSSSNSSVSGENATSSGNTTTSSDSSVSSEKPTSSENSNTSSNNSDFENDNTSSGGNSNSSENSSQVGPGASDKEPYVSTNTSSNENSKPNSSSVTSVNPSKPSNSDDTDSENSSATSSGNDGTVSSDRTDSGTTSDKTDNNGAASKPDDNKTNGNGTNAAVIIVIISAAVMLIGGGAAAYYFLIMKPKMSLHSETFVIPEPTEVDGSIESDENTNL